MSIRFYVLINTLLDGTIQSYNTRATMKILDILHHALEWLSRNTYNTIVALQTSEKIRCKINSFVITRVVAYAKKEKKTNLIFRSS